MDDLTDIERLVEIDKIIYWPLSDDVAPGPHRSRLALRMFAAERAEDHAAIEKLVEAMFNDYLVELTGAVQVLFSAPRYVVDWERLVDAAVRVYDKVYR